MELTQLQDSVSIALLATEALAVAYVGLMMLRSSIGLHVRSWQTHPYSER
jgi:hypothetical protein